MGIYTKQGFYEGMVLTHEHLNKIEDGIISSASTNSPYNINRTVRFVGMSIWWYDGNTLSASGFGGGVKAKGYQTLLKQVFNFKNTVNYCYSGFSLGGTSASDGASICNKMSTWSGSDGDIWTLDTITNDFKRNIPIGTINDYNNSTGITTYFGALRKFKDTITSLCGSNHIVICSNALRRNNASYTSISKNTVGHALLDYEKALMHVASLNNWYFVDQYRLSGINDDTLQFTTLDGLHLNNFGYTLAVKPWIEQFTIVSLSEGISADNSNANERINGYIDRQGAFVDNTSTWNRTNYIETDNGQQWKYTGKTDAASAASAVYGYNIDMAPVKEILGVIDATDGETFIIDDEDIKYIACCSYIVDINFNIEKV